MCPPAFMHSSLNNFIHVECVANTDYTCMCVYVPHVLELVLECFGVKDVLYLLPPEGGALHLFS